MYYYILMEGECIMVKDGKKVNSSMWRRCNFRAVPVAWSYHSIGSHNAPRRPTSGPRKVRSHRRGHPLRRGRHPVRRRREGRHGRCREASSKRRTRRRLSPEGRGVPRGDGARGNGEVAAPRSRHTIRHRCTFGGVSDLHFALRQMATWFLIFYTAAPFRNTKLKKGAFDCTLVTDRCKVGVIRSFAFDCLADTIIQPYEPSGIWLVKQWSGTILQYVWQKELVMMMLTALFGVVLGQIVGDMSTSAEHPLLNQLRLIGGWWSMYVY